MAAAGGGDDLRSERAGLALAERRNRGLARGPGGRGEWRLFLSTVVVCFYIGYFGAGAGFLLITLLSLFGHQDLNEINALKVVSTTMANGIAFVIFAVDGQVEWHYCLLAMVTVRLADIRRRGSRGWCRSGCCGGW